MAAVHAACFTTPRPWSSAEIVSILDSALREGQQDSVVRLRDWAASPRGSGEKYTIWSVIWRQRLLNRPHQHQSIQPRARRGLVITATFAFRLKAFAGVKALRGQVIGRHFKEN